MKRVVFIFLLLVGFGINIDAQVLSRNMFNDGRLIAYIQPRQSHGARNDYLRLRNISEQEITVTYRIRREHFIGRNNVWDRTSYITNTVTIQPERLHTRSVLPSGSTFGHIDSFAILNVSVRQSTPPPSSTRPAPLQPSSSIVPSVLVGIWHRAGAVTATVTISANQIQIVYSDGRMFIGNITNIGTETNTGRHRNMYPTGWSISYTMTTVIGNFPFSVGQYARSYFFINNTNNRLVQPDDDRVFERL